MHPCIASVEIRAENSFRFADGLAALRMTGVDGGEWDARQFAAAVGGVAFAILGRTWRKSGDRGMFTNSFLMVTGDQVSKKTGKRPVCPLPFVPFS